MHFTTIITTFICFALAAAQTTTDPVTGVSLLSHINTKYNGLTAKDPRQCLRR